MRFIKLCSLLLVAGLLSACGASVTPILQKEPTFISGAKVTMAKLDEGTVNLPEDLRVKVLRDASRHSQTGNPKILKIHVIGFHVKNPVQSWLIGDSDSIYVEVEVVDKKSGRVDNKFKVVAMRVGVQGIAGAVLSAINNPVEVEQELTTLISNRIFLRLYGAAKVEMASKREPAKITAKYPRDYESLKVEHKCKQDYANSKVRVDPNSDPIEYKPAQHCLKYLPKEKRFRR
ncbi:MAG: hypothetical protein ACRBBN_09785 [Methyloligellaceae bacterium]